MTKKKRRRLRRFNGTGSVYMLSGRRARPWVARIISGKDERGKYTYAYTYHQSSAEASLAITGMINALHQTSQSKTTISQLWEQFQIVRFPKISQSSIAGYKSAYTYWSPLHDREISSIRTSELQGIINSYQDMSHSHLSKMRATMVGLYKIAMKDDVVSKNCASLIELPKEASHSSRRSFSEDELLRVRTAALNGVPYADRVLFMCYTGWRPTEMCLLTKKSVNTQEWIIIGGIKTESGINRSVPIHKSIRAIVVQWLEKNHSTLFTDKRGRPLNKDKWSTRFASVMKKIGITEDLVPYTTRHTCASILHAAGADHLSIAKILGHKDYKITANIYTHLNLDELKTAVDLLK